MGGGPHVSRALEKGDPEAVAQLDEVVRERLLDDPVVTVRLWEQRRHHRLPDKPPLIGQRFDLGDEELEVLNNGGVEAEVSDLSKPENRFEHRVRRELIEVYLPAQGRTAAASCWRSTPGRPSWSSRPRGWSSRWRPRWSGAPAVLALILLLLAWRMARRLDATAAPRGPCSMR